jgi:hypothetical protein
VNLRNGWDVLVVEWFVVGIAVGVPPLCSAWTGGRGLEASLEKAPFSTFAGRNKKSDTCSRV